MWWRSPPRGSRWRCSLQERQSALLMTANTTASPFIVAEQLVWTTVAFDTVDTTVSDAPVELLPQTGCRAALKASSDVRLWTTSREASVSAADGCRPAHWQEDHFAAEALRIVLRGAKLSRSSMTRRSTPEKRNSDLTQLLPASASEPNVTELSFGRRKHFFHTGWTVESPEARRVRFLQQQEVCLGINNQKQTWKTALYSTAGRDLTLTHNTRDNLLHGIGLLYGRGLKTSTPRQEMSYDSSNLYTRI